MMTWVLKLVQFWQPAFPAELFWCGIRQDGRRLFLPLMSALALILSMLVLMGSYFALAPYGSNGLGGRMLPALTFSVTLGLFIFLGMNVPFALRAATTEDDLPLVMMTGLPPLAVWRAQVWSAALPALMVPVLHLPLLMYIFTMGGVGLMDVAALGVFWLIAWLTFSGWAALAGCIWSGPTRERMQGMSLTLMLVFGYGVVQVAVARVLWLMKSPWVWYSLSSFQPPWNGTFPEYFRLSVHAVFGLLAAWVSVVLLRGRWRSAVEAGSRDMDKAVDVVSESPAKTVPRHQVRPSFARVQAAARPRCSDDPWFWKDFHVSGGSWLYWQIRAGTAVVLSVIGAVCLGWGLQYRIVEPTIFLTMVGWFIWMLFDTGQVLSNEFQDRMWSIVRITPNSVSHILSGKLRAAAVRFLPALLPLGLVCLFGLMTYAWQMVVVGVPILLLITIPFSVLILYGTAIPQNLIGGGWPMLRTLFGVVVALTVYVPVMILIDYTIQPELEVAAYWAFSVFMSFALTAWLSYATLCELNDPRRERQSADGG